MSNTSVYHLRRFLNRNWDSALLADRVIRRYYYLKSIEVKTK